MEKHDKIIVVSRGGELDICKTVVEIAVIMSEKPEQIHPDSYAGVTLKLMSAGF